MNISNVGFIAAFAIVAFFLIELFLYRRAKKKQMLQEIPGLEVPVKKGTGLKRTGMILAILLMVGGIVIITTQLNKTQPTRPRAYGPEILPSNTPTPSFIITTTPSVTPSVTLAITGTPTPTPTLAFFRVITPIALPTTATIAATVAPTIQPIGGEVSLISPSPTITPTTIPKPTVLLQTGVSNYSIILSGIGAMIVFLSFIF